MHRTRLATHRHQRQRKLKCAEYDDDAVRVYISANFEATIAIRLAGSI